MADVKTYVEFLHSGRKGIECSVREVPSREIGELVIPQDAIGFIFFEEKSTQEDGVTMKSSRLDPSGIYYLGGRLMTLNEVRRELPYARDLIANMIGEGARFVIQCPPGNFMPFRDSDTLISRM